MLGVGSTKDGRGCTHYLPNNKKLHHARSVMLCPLILHLHFGGPIELTKVMRLKVHAKLSGQKCQEKSIRHSCPNEHRTEEEQQTTLGNLSSGI